YPPHLPLSKTTPAQTPPVTSRLQEQDRSEGTRSAAEGRMQEQAVFGFFFPRKKVTRRNGGRGQQHNHIKWKSLQFLSPPASR
ncbi:hypothetical protein, partial [Pseudomonas hunanensis]|uniref:hypothetical protein n=1 Tax=Pseudomonas hunanensis TaxID=1247546 RepID=UPI00286B9840